MLTSLLEPVRTGPRFERKCVLDESRALQLLAWTAARCAPDPHGATDATYLVESVYCDTEDFAIWKSTGPTRMARYRLRRYGRGTACFLEEKLRLQDRVWKR